MELSGLLAVSIVVLIVFMMQPSPHHTSMVDLPLTRHAVLMPKARREDAIKVTITNDGTVYFRNYRTTRDDLPRAIQEAVRDGAEAKVYIAIDARARYSAVERVIDAIRQTRIANVVFLASTAYQ